MFGHHSALLLARKLSVAKLSLDLSTPSTVISTQKKRNLDLSACTLASFSRSPSAVTHAHVHPWACAEEWHFVHVLDTPPSQGAVTS